MSIIWLIYCFFIYSSNNYNCISFFKRLLYTCFTPFICLLHTCHIPVICLLYTCYMPFRCLLYACYMPDSTHHGDCYWPSSRTPTRSSSSAHSMEKRLSTTKARVFLFHRTPRLTLLGPGLRRSITYRRGINWIVRDLNVYCTDNDAYKWKPALVVVYLKYANKSKRVLALSLLPALMWHCLKELKNT